ncbi:hypothetical protein Mal15_55430 [Stieleria maiorica]|uniref:Uncharacterized protein n=1 Tax=Stieleria maiorica TaxID=2795974 RepID=A0A5B9MNF3_9BACT|nr:hypothetical protein [Stieleria maiorica]QEG01467.1 hypothetical protein Mal15_55430 [Stieleria maiorica]
MFCICMPKVAEMAAGIQVPPVAIQMPPLPAGAAGLAAAAGIAAAVNVTAEMAASGALDAVLSAELPPFSLEAVLAMESMAQVGASLGIEMTSPSAAMDLSLAAGALNIAAPALGDLGGALGAAMEPLGGLPMALGINAAIESSLGIDMAAPGAAAALEASLAAALEASLAMSGTLGLSAAGGGSFAMELALAARALNAALALGFNPAAPGEFAAALEMAGGLEVPPLAMSAGEMGEVSAGLSDFGLVSGAMGGQPMEMALPAMEAGAAALAANLEAAVDASAAMAAELTGGAGGSAELAAAMSAAAEAPMPAAPALSAMEMGGLPSMGDLSVAATMAASFEAAMGTPMISGAPCPNIFCVAGR